MATYTLTINYGASNATIETNCGTAGVYHNGNYWYKITSSKVYRSSTSATSGFSVLAPSKSATSGSSGTSKTVLFDLMNIATPGFIRPGYHTVSASAWKTPGGLALNQNTSATSDTNAATVYRVLDNKYISANKTVTIQPNWVGNSYTINYNGNGATSGSTASSSHVYGTAKNLTANGFSKTGYTFQGWSKNAPSGTQIVDFTDEESITTITDASGNAPSNEDTITLYAVWKAKTINLGYDANGGSGGPTGGTVTYGQSFTVPSTIPTYTGKKFLGWATGGGASQQAAAVMALSKAAQGTIDHTSGQTFTWNYATPYVCFAAVWQDASVYVKDSGTWTTAIPYVKVNSTWKAVNEIHVKINGSWQQIT